MAVTTTMAGDVVSQFYGNYVWRGLPADSRYKAIETAIAKMAVGDIGAKPEDPLDFARRLLDDGLSGATGQVRRGAMA